MAVHVKVNVFAGGRKHVDHLAPIWMALDPDERGVWINGARDALQRLTELGLRADSRLHRSMPSPKRTPPGAWLVASFGDMQTIGSKRGPIILLEHGAGQHYGGDGGTSALGDYPGGKGRDAVTLFLCPNKTVAHRNSVVYPNAATAVVGCPKLDPWMPGMYEAEHLHHRPEPDSEPVVCLAWHWDCTAPPEARSALEHYVASLPDLARAMDHFGFHLIGTGHPTAWFHLRTMYERLGITTVEHFDDVLARADLLVADNTSAMWEFAATDRPVVVLNAPWYRRDVEHGLRFWEFADVGRQVNEPGELVAAIVETIAFDTGHQRRAEISEAIYGRLDGRAADRAVKAIRSIL